LTAALAPPLEGFPRPSRTTDRPGSICPIGSERASARSLLGRLPLRGSRTVAQGLGGRFKIVASCRSGTPISFPCRVKRPSARRSRSGGLPKLWSSRLLISGSKVNLRYSLLPCLAVELTDDDRTWLEIRSSAGCLFPVSNGLLYQAVPEHAWSSDQALQRREPGAGTCFLSQGSRAESEQSYSYVRPGMMIK